MSDEMFMAIMVTRKPPSVGTVMLGPWGKRKNTRWEISQVVCEARRGEWFVYAVPTKKPLSEPLGRLVDV